MKESVIFQLITDQGGLAFPRYPATGCNGCASQW